jgi:hypothetical protein
MRLYEQAKAKLTASLPGIGANTLYAGSGSGSPHAFPIWATGESGTLYWCQCTILYDGDNGNLSEGPNWGKWQAFTPLPNGATASSFAGEAFPTVLCHVGL